MYGKIALEKHVDIVHVIIVQNLEEEVNALLRGSIEKQPTKKRLYVLGNARSFNCVKSIAIVDCGKCLVQASNFTSMSSSCLP
jgi:hypothetical protein